MRRLQAEGIELAADGERLRVNAARGQLCAALRAQIAEHKQDLLRLLATADFRKKAGPPEVSPAPSEGERRRAAQRSFEGDFPLSFAQRRLWFLDRLETDSNAYNIGASRFIDLALDEAAMTQAVNDVVARQASLRTVFPEIDGDTVQRVLPFAPVPLPVDDLRTLAAGERLPKQRALIREEAARRFDLAQGPLFRARLLRLEDARYVLLFSMHHIICDGWSLAVFLQDLHDCYEARAAGRQPTLEPLALQYAEFAAGERRRLEGPALESLLAYWRNRLADAPAVLELPTDRPRPPRRTVNGDSVTFAIPVPLTERLRALARGEGATSFMVLLAVFNTLLFRYSDQPDIVVGTPLANRASTDLERLIGMFVTTLPIRTRLDGEPSGRELIARIREQVLDAQAHSDLPFEKLVDELRPQRSLAWSPVFQVMFVLQNTPLSSAFETATVAAMYDLTLFMWDEPGGLRGALEYNTDLFDRATAERLGRHFVQLAEAIAADPDRPVSRLPMLAPDERRQLLVDWNDTARPYPRDSDLGTLFDEAARRHGDAVALESAEPQGELLPVARLTYAALAEATDRLAADLRARGIGVGQSVGLCMERSIGAVVSIVAIVKAGAAYVPLDPADPEPRLAGMLHEADVRTVLTQRALAPKRAAGNVTVLALEDLWESVVAAPAASPASRPALSADASAYVMFTSGTTGRPKGVRVTHRNVARLVCNTDFVELGPAETLLQFAPLAFDASTFEIWGALLNGAKLVVFPRNVPTAAELGQTLVQHRISTLWLTAGLFHQMVENAPQEMAGVRQVLTGGDVVSASHVRRLLAARPEGVVVNGYGPTENTTFTCCHRMTAATPPGDSVPIGRPIANTQAYLLDRHGELVPIGVAGELFAGGDGVASGYIADVQPDEARFVPDPFASRSGATMYRTGDLARWRADGAIDFIGRRDRQVKVRGFRIELEEIENCLRGIAALGDAAAVARRDSAGVNRLVAYVVPAAGDAVDEAAIRRHLTERLPGHMLPQDFVTLAKLPLTANGKLDRDALPDPDHEAAGHGAVEPRTLVEAQLYAIWERVLGRTGFGVHDNFFQLGGHSLLAVRLFAQIERTFGARLPISALFVAPDIERLGERIEQAGFSSPWSSLVPIRTEGAGRPLFLVPGIGGNVVCYSELARWLGDEQPLYALQSQGLDGREPPFERIEPMAAHYLREIRQVQPHGPYRLGGSCFGGVVAYEMAQQLAAAGEQVDTLFLLETWPGARRRPLMDALRMHSHQLRFIVSATRRNIAALRQVPWRELGTALKTRFGIVGEIVSQRDLYRGDRAMMYVDRVSMANLAALTRYRPRRYPGGVLLARATLRRIEGEDRRRVWHELAQGGCVEIDLPATDSGDMLKPPHAEPLARWILQSLQASPDCRTGAAAAAGERNAQAQAA